MRLTSSYPVPRECSTELKYNSIKSNKSVKSAWLYGHGGISVNVIINGHKGLWSDLQLAILPLFLRNYYNMYCVCCDLMEQSLEKISKSLRIFCFCFGVGLLDNAVIRV